MICKVFLHGILLMFFMCLMSFVFTFFVSVTGPDVFICDLTDFLSWDMKVSFPFSEYCNKLVVKINWIQFKTVLFVM